MKIPKGKTKKKEIVTVKNMCHKLTVNLTQLETTLSEKETEIIKIKLVESIGKEKKNKLRAKLKELHEEEEKLKLEEHKFNKELEKTMRNEQISKEHEKTLNRQKRKIQKKFTKLRKAIEEE